MQEHVSYKYPAIFMIVGGLIIITMLIGDSFGDNETYGTALTNTTPTALVQEPTDTDIPATETPVPPTDVPTEVPTSSPVPTDLPEPTAADDSTDSETTSADYPAELVAHGETLFAGTCAACHGPDARGLPNLGKDLVASEFVHSQTDEELVDFIITGRPIWDPANTTSIDMPPRGGNPALTDEDIHAIVAYLRTLEASGEDATTSGETSSVDENTTDSSTASNGNDFDPVLAEEGATLFAGTCAACHGPDAHGLPNLGKDLVTSEFVHSQSNDELVDFIITGRPIWDPANTTSIDMPPRGGNPALTDEQIMAIVHYLRSLEE